MTQSPAPSTRLRRVEPVIEKDGGVIIVSSLASGTPITLNEREMSRQDAEDAKKKKLSWRPWRLGGSKFCSYQAGSTRLSLWWMSSSLRMTSAATTIVLAEAGRVVPVDGTLEELAIRGDRHQDPGAVVGEGPSIGDRSATTERSQLLPSSFR
ncbi:hypothetical protein [Sorangium sp. So ce233]|uniref:hypothetical protein n=1 Tax=Sorangium sp. So ce233 TaxID=3133290 RepID=UPI003F5DE716